MSTLDDSQRVVITGIGVVSPIGIGKDEFWKGLEEGRSGIKPVTLFDVSSVQSKLAGEISDFNPEAILGPKGLRNLDRTTKLALCASKLALDDAGLQITEENAHEVGVVLGSTMGSVCSISDFDKEGIKNGPKGINPALFPNTVMNSPASQIAIRFGIKGFNATISSGFASSLDAIEYAQKFIFLKRARAIVVGGVEELCEQSYKGFYKIGYLSSSCKTNHEVSAPFDKRRNGAVMAEGSMIIVLESLENAKKRGVNIYAEISGMGSGCRVPRVSPRIDDWIRATMRAYARTIKNAGLNTTDIDYASAAANSSITGDAVESRSLSSFFGKGITASSIKSMIGETFSASGAFQVAAALLALERNVIHPTINYQKTDKRCGEIDCIPNVARTARIKNVLISNVGLLDRSIAMTLSKGLL